MKLTLTNILPATVSSCFSTADTSDSHIQHPLCPPDFRALAIDSSLHTASTSLQARVGEKSEDHSVGRSNIKYSEVNILKGQTSTQWNDGQWFLGKYISEQPHYFPEERF